MTRIQLCTGLLRRADTLLLVRCRYDGEPEPLWVLPGGRQETTESIPHTIIREFFEETSLRVVPQSLAYVSESIDERRSYRVTNYSFNVSESDVQVQPRPRDPNVVEVRFVAHEEAIALLAADVLRIPVAAALSSDAHPRYFAFTSADIAVPFFGRAQSAGA